VSERHATASSAPAPSVSRLANVHGVADFDGTGDTRRAVRLVGTVADITESKQQEEHTRYLMREVDHRGKNIMSVVQSIARLTAKSGHANFAARFTDRMHALAASQDVIVNGNWHNVDIGELVRSQLAHFKDLIDTRIAIEGEPLNISPAAAQTLGMALHELATNASKYGALSNAKGRVTIGWRVSSAAGDDKFEIDWTEHDGPVVVAPTEHGFGTTVVESMTKSGLSASVRLEYLATGLEWHVACPSDRVRARPSDAEQSKVNSGADPQDPT
jgi:two-component sensor histidine kinase